MKQLRNKVIGVLMIVALLIMLAAYFYFAMHVWAPGQ